MGWKRRDTQKKLIITKTSCPVVRKHVRARVYTQGASTLLPTTPGFQEGYVGETRVDGETNAFQTT